MVEALRFAQDHGYKYSITELCQTVGISRECFYHWRTYPDFVRYWTEALDSYFAGKLDSLYAEQAVIAEKGAQNTSQTAAAKFLAERFDAAYAKQALFNVPGGVSIHFHALTDSESASVIDVESEPVRELVAGEDGYEEAEVDNTDQG